MWQSAVESYRSTTGSRWLQGGGRERVVGDLRKGWPTSPFSPTASATRGTYLPSEGCA